MPEQMRLLLVDDHVLVRSGLRMLLQAQPDMCIVAEAETGAQAVHLVQRHHPDVVLMDIQMPDMNGIEATKKIKEIYADTAVIALTMHENDQYFFEMLRAGASGYVPKRAAPDELVRAIRTVNRGEIFLYPSLASRLVQNYLGPSDQDASPSLDNLTPREKEVLTLIAEGLTNPEIAEKLVISVKTVDRHRENTMQKLNLHNRVDLVKYALKQGLIELED